MYSNPATSPEGGEVGDITALGESTLILASMMVKVVEKFVDY
jgi:hypothetical protein